MGYFVSGVHHPCNSPDDPLGFRIWSRNFAPFSQTYIQAKRTLKSDPYGCFLAYTDMAQIASKMGHFVSGGHLNSLTHPTGRFWSFFSNKTFGTS